MANGSGKWAFLDAVLDEDMMPWIVLLGVSPLDATVKHESSGRTAYTRTFGYLTTHLNGSNAKDLTQFTSWPAHNDGLP